MQRTADALDRAGSQCPLTPRKADYLIAGDRDLLADRHPIVTPASFRVRHGG